MARIETPEMTWTGATAPGLPFVIIGSNGTVVWTFTTTMATRRICSRKSSSTAAPITTKRRTEPQPFLTRQESDRGQGRGRDVEVTVRSTPRAGGIRSQRRSGDAGHRVGAELDGLLPDDRHAGSDSTALNNARRCRPHSRVALVDFHAPEQNVVYADTEGVTGFIAAGRVPWSGARSMPRQPSAGAGLERRL